MYNYYAELCYIFCYLQNKGKTKLCKYEIHDYQDECFYTFCYTKNIFNDKICIQQIL